jgi:hypothetical protein
VYMPFSLLMLLLRADAAKSPPIVRSALPMHFLLDWRLMYEAVSSSRCRPSGPHVLAGS